MDKNKTGPHLLILDIGCGPNKVKGAQGVDRLAYPGVDIVCDFEADPLPFADSSVDVIYANHVLEHMKGLDAVLREFVRVLKPGARLSVTCPHWSCALGYSDPTHVRFMGYYTFYYYSKDRDGCWGVPNYTSDIWFKIVEVRFNFRNWSIFGKLLDKVFNANRRMKYIYESKLAWVIPCFEIHYELRADK